MRLCTAVLALLLAAPAAAQVIDRPTEPPIVTAENDAWYRAGEPMTFAGGLYVPGGPPEFFNGNRMVRTGHFNGVPLYADATLEPYSIVFVPIARGLMQPYERLRRDELAGTVGSRTPSVPPRRRPEGDPLPVAVATPGGRGPVAALDVTRELGAVGTAGRAAAPSPVGTAGSAAAAPGTVTMMSLPAATSSTGVWVSYLGEKWVNEGTAVALRPAEFVRIGEYGGVPVYTRHGLQEEAIYLPSGQGRLARYRLSP